MLRLWLFVGIATTALAFGGCGTSATDRGGERSFSDPAGDQYLQPGCGDIRRLAVSENRGLIDLTVEIRSLTCLAVVLLDTDEDRHIDYSLEFRRNMSSAATVETVWRWSTDNLLSDARVKLRGASRQGDRYSLRFAAAAIGVKRALGFEAHIDGRIPTLVTDSAPDDPDSWFTYRLSGG